MGCVFDKRDTELGIRFNIFLLINKMIFRKLIQLLMMIRLVVQPTQVEPAGGSQYLVLQHSPWAGRELWTDIPLS